MLKIPVQVGWEEGVDSAAGEGSFALFWREEKKCTLIGLKLNLPVRARQTEIVDSSDLLPQLNDIPAPRDAR
jgi:hypothetical protein